MKLSLLTVPFTYLLGIHGDDLVAANHGRSSGSWTTLSHCVRLIPERETVRRFVQAGVCTSTGLPPLGRSEGTLLRDDTPAGVGNWNLDYFRDCPCRNEAEFIFLIKHRKSGPGLSRGKKGSDSLLEWPDQVKRGHHHPGLCLHLTAMLESFDPEAPVPIPRACPHSDQGPQYYYTALPGELDTWKLTTCTEPKLKPLQAVMDPGRVRERDGGKTWKSSLILPLEKSLLTAKSRGCIWLVN